MHTSHPLQTPDTSDVAAGHRLGGSSPRSQPDPVLRKQLLSRSGHVGRRGLELGPPGHGNLLA
jgi:hypothetical protein